MPHFKMNYDGIPALNHFLEDTDHNVGDNGRKCVI